MLISALFLWQFSEDFSKLVKLRASKISQIARTKTGRALFFVINDRYEVPLPISLIFRRSNVFPDRECWLKNGLKSEKSRNFPKIMFFLFLMSLKK